MYDTKTCMCPFLAQNLTLNLNQTVQPLLSPRDDTILTALQCALILPVQAVLPVVFCTTSHALPACQCVPRLWIVFLWGYLTCQRLRRDVLMCCHYHGEIATIGLQPVIVAQSVITHNDHCNRMNFIRTLQEIMH
jgi:hypothetical protein